MKSDGLVEDMLRKEGQRLASLRTEAGLTQHELSEICDVSQSYIARMEKGKLDPKHSVVLRITQAIETHVTSRRLRALFGNVRCGEIMVEAPEAVDARDPASHAAAIMQKHSYSQLPVLRGSAIVGIITETDLLAEIHHDFNSLSVQAVMSPDDPPIVSENAPVARVIPLLRDYQAVFVQSRGRLRGIITRADILKLKT